MTQSTKTPTALTAPFVPLFFIVLCFVLALTLTACSNNTASDVPVTSDVKDRQSLMKDWRSANDIMKGMVENPANFDATAFKEQAQFLADTAPTMWSYFKDETAKGQGDDAIWQNYDEFQQATDNFDKAVMALNATAQTATNTADIETPLAQVYESCGSCHKRFKR